MPAPAQMTCKELVELVTDYLEDALPPAEVRRFEEHLKECRGCTAYLQQFRQMIDAMGRLTEDAVPDDARDKLLQAFRDWKKEQGPHRSGPAIPTE